MCDVFMNEVRMENEPLQKLEENANVQIDYNFFMIYHLV
jgi:hypothetical protein